MRYTKSYWKQGLIIFFSMLVMGEIYIEELKNPNIVYIDGQEYDLPPYGPIDDSKRARPEHLSDQEPGCQKA